VVTPFAALSRSIVFVLAVASLLFIVSNGPEPAAAFDDLVEFSLSNVEILDGESVEVTVTIFRDLTADEVTAGSVEVRLIEQDFPSDDVIDTQNVDVPDDQGEGDTFEFTIKFTLKCVDGTVEGASGGEVDLRVDFGSGTLNSPSFSVKCKDGIAVIFDPEDLDIFEGDSEEVTVHITKLITQTEKLAGEINVDLVDVDGTLDPDDRLGEADVKHTGTSNNAKVVVQHTFTLKCVKNEIQGKDGEMSGEDEVVLAIEIDNGPTNHGTGAARCVEREVSFFNSTGSMPSDVTVDEEAGLAYFLNAGGPGVDVYTTAGSFVESIALPCPAETTGLGDAQPAFFHCLWQGVSIFEFFGVRYLVAADNVDAIVYLIILLLLGGGDAESAGSGPSVGDVISIPVGPGPRGSAFDPATNQIYVAAFTQGRVYVIDAETMTEVTQVITGGSPNDIAIDSDAGLVYVTNFNGDVVSVIDTATNQNLNNIDVGDGPEGIEVDPETGDVWVANVFGGSVSVIDSESLGSAEPVVDTFAVGGGAIDLAINPLTDRVFVANAFDDTVSIIDRTTHEVVGTVDVGDSPDAVAVSPTAGFVYVANHGDDTYAFISDPPPSTDPPPVDTGLPLIWGDDDCDGDADAVDALKTLQHVAALPFGQSDPCFPLGETVSVTPAGSIDRRWSDVDCDGDVDAVDALGILRDIAAFPVNQEPGCPLIGSEVTVAVI